MNGLNAAVVIRGSARDVVIETYSPGNSMLFDTWMSQSKGTDAETVAQSGGFSLSASGTGTIAYQPPVDLGGSSTATPGTLSTAAFNAGTLCTASAVNRGTLFTAAEVNAGYYATLYTLVASGHSQSGDIESISSEPEATTPPSLSYPQLFSAIECLGSLDPTENHFIDSDAARSARLFLSLLSLYSVAPPQIFPHGGDAVVFKWSDGTRNDRYVTLVDGSTFLREYSSGVPVAAPIEFDISSENKLVALMEELGGKRWRAVTAS